jgi:hypothetical protein
MTRKRRQPKDAAQGFAAAVSQSQQADEQPAPTGRPQPAEETPTAARTPVTGRQVKPHSKQALVYLHPEGHRAIKLYAAEADRPMQDVMTELLERGARQLGISAPMQPKPPESDD